jgi:catechol 2,3-dioxygenase-like lactoylglutathione lyase family enzyme
MDDNRPPGLASILHVALTVTNAESSADWYGRVLGFERAMTVPHAGGFGIVMHSPDQRVWVVLHHHDANDQQRFSETRTGLDHVCFQVESYDQLEALAGLVHRPGCGAHPDHLPGPVRHVGPGVPRPRQPPAGAHHLRLR